MKKPISSLLQLQPIGELHSHRRVKFEVPHQPRQASGETNKIELYPGCNFEQALRDLDGFDHIWLLWWFHRNRSWKPLVRPPRGSSVKRGVFATRSPHRPNPLGLTVVRLIEVRRRTLTVGPVDLLDGTPILDIKPYIPEIDSLPGSRAGWVDELECRGDTHLSYIVKLTSLAELQRSWLIDNYGIDFLARATELLSIDPRPHRTRRITKLREGEFRIGCGAWRAVFNVNGHEVVILRLARGYPDKALSNPAFTKIPDREAQIAFAMRWPQL